MNYNENYIKRILNLNKIKLRFSLKLKTYVIINVINVYIKYKIEDLNKIKSYNNKLRNNIKIYL
jgi:hypothetical protein